MFKVLPYYDKSSFVKRKKKLNPIFLNKNVIFSKKIINLKKKIILTSLKRLFSQIKKKKYIFFVNLRLNLIKSFKSKNARMGKGKGVFKNQLLRPIRHNTLIISNISRTRKNKLLFFFKKKSIINH